MSVDALKYLISQKGGVAKSNLFKVTLPALKTINPNYYGSEYINTEEINILCTGVNLPFRQIQTTERQIGPKAFKMPRAIIEDDVSMTFLVLNDYGIKKYFDEWQNQIIDRQTYEVGYVADYSHPVVIEQLKQSYVAKWKDTSYDNYYSTSSLQGLWNMFSKGLKNDLEILPNIERNNVSYRCTLLDAYPTSLSEIQMTNDPNGLVQITVQFSFRTQQTDEDSRRK